MASGSLLGRGDDLVALGHCRFGRGLGGGQGRRVLGLGPAGIAFATLAPPDAAWDLATGQAQALADYPYGRGVYPRGWLDAAWQRLRGHARPPRPPHDGLARRPGRATREAAGTEGCGRPLEG